jgi:predicted Zn-dependent protease
MLMQIGTMAAGVAVSDMDDRSRMAVMGALGMGTQYGIMRPFSRDHESEADYMGLIYSARACFDPTEAPKLRERMGPTVAEDWRSSLQPIHRTRHGFANFRSGGPKR